MPPPPVTPSPHRFVVRRDTSELRADERPHPRAFAPSTTPSTAAPQTLPHSRPPPRPAGAANQFNATPRFAFASTPASAGRSSLPPSTPSASLPLASSATTHHVRSRLRGFVGLAPETVDSQEEQLTRDAGDGWTSDASSHAADDLPSVKRRRLSLSISESEDGHLSDASASLPRSGWGSDDTAARHGDTPEDGQFSSLPDIASPSGLPRRPLPKSVSRFLPSQPAARQAAEELSFQHAPRFQLDTDDERFQTPDADPLPEFFSPRRRGHKFVVGGLAAQTRDWLLRLDAGSASRHGLPTRAVSALVRVAEVREGNTATSEATWSLVRGWRMLDADAEDGSMTPPEGRVMLNLILAGTNAVGWDDQRASVLQVGNIVEIRKPVWEVEVENVSWVVCVDHTVRRGSALLESASRR